MQSLKNKVLIIVFFLIYFTSSSYSQELDSSYSPELLNGYQYFLCELKNEVLQDKIEEWLGTPYKSGCNTKLGTDCSGFVQSIYKEVYNMNLIHGSREMIKEGERVKRISELKEGDLLFFKTERHRVSHVGIYLKDGLFVHASTSNGVEIASLELPYYKKTYFRAGRVLLEN